MSGPDFRVLTDRITVPYQAAFEQRRHRQRGGDRRSGADCILATVLFQRDPCNQQALAASFGVGRAAPIATP
ncbi:hypothetical protein [Streptomyces exfoliatus]|uniref:hypothetical protein n=1 Tax=Streptomyces exfoliatus TaxID=1905 RepID=UPI003C2B319A